MISWFSTKELVHTATRLLVSNVIGAVRQAPPSRQCFKASAAAFLLLALAMPGHAVAASAGPLALVLEPADFGTVPVGTTQRLTVTARNTSVTPLSVTRVSALGTPFRIDSNGCSGKALAPGGTCQADCVRAIRYRGAMSDRLMVDLTLTGECP